MDRRVPAAHRVSFTVRGEQWLRLVGPRYHGAWRLSPQACRAGLVKVKARPRDARVQFHCSPKTVVVRCTGCSGKVDGQWRLPEDFPWFATEGLHQEVVFELKAAGFYPKRVRAVIHPGDNEIDAHLKPRD